MDTARAALIASNAPKTFWHYAVMHAVDCLNRTTGPPNSHKSAYEELTGQPPKIMGVYPFGCRMYAVKPRSAYSKASFDSRAWVGMNLGLCASIPGAYNIWCPKAGRVVMTSDAYVDETYMPWQPPDERRVDIPVPHLAQAPADQSPGIPPSSHDSPPQSVPVDKSMDAAYHRATRDEAPQGLRSRKVFLLFSGPYNRPDG